jgi:hypothetical protein
MKADWRRIGCLGCGLVSLLLLGVVALFVFAGVEVLSEEFTPLRAIPSSNEDRIDPTSKPSDPIPDVAYIEVDAVGYSDDDDPQDEGVAIDIQFYNSESEPMSFSDVPMSTEIQLIAFRDLVDMLESQGGERVYSGSITLDHTMRLGEIFGDYIRIPYDQVSMDPAAFERFGEVRVTVEIPQQGSFQASFQPVPLYEE